MTSITTMQPKGQVFPPPTAFQSQALIQSVAAYEALWNYAKDNPEAFWGGQATSLLTWDMPWGVVRTGTGMQSQWFTGGYLNASVNCLDRHLETQGDKLALIAEGEPGEVWRLTYRDLHREVCKLANGLRSLGLQQGDVVAIYMPMVPELVIAVLACARLGLMHSVIFAGFSAEAIRSRNADAQAKLIITADGLYRRGAVIPLKETVDHSLEGASSVEHVLVYQRTGASVSMHPGRDLWWHDLMAMQSETCAPVSVPAEHPLFLLYTSGSTGTPKGIVHTTAGYLLGTALSHRYIFDLKPTDRYWCTADAGWITGHSYVIYGPLCNGTTVVMYEGAPNFPDWARFWKIIETHGVTQFYTAPTAIRSLMQQGDAWPEKHDLSSLRLLGTVGEPINPKAWMWFHEKIGKTRCPIVDTWWQTETGAIMIAPLPGAISTKPGCATRPFFGIVPDVVDHHGVPVGENQGGLLVVRQPWPSMLRTIHGDHDRFLSQYCQVVPGDVYFTGDGARRDADGDYWILGRVDDVLNVAGHRLSTMEIESALVSHPTVAEAAVVGKPDEVRGEAICCFVTLKATEHAGGELKKQLQFHVVAQIGALARPQEIRFVQALPKTRSGKIMRRLLRDLAADRPIAGDVSTLEDLATLDTIRAASTEDDT